MVPLTQLIKLQFSKVKKLKVFVLALRAENGRYGTNTVSEKICRKRLFPLCNISELEHIRIPAKFRN